MADPTHSGIYEIVNTANGKRYIGSAVDFKARWRGHRHALNHKKHHSLALQRAWTKYGSEAFDFRVIELCECPDLIAREQLALDVLRPEYNACKTAGSSQGRKMSAASRAKLSRAKAGRPLTPEHREAIATGNRGRTTSPEAVAKSAAARRGKPQGPLSEAHRQKIGAAHRGRKLTPAHVEAISRAKVGKARPDMAGNCWGSRKHTPEECAANRERQRGKKRSEETKARMRAAWERRKAASS